MKPHYLGPLIVISCNKGGAYIICELDGSVLHHPVAAFRLLPYLARKSIELPNDFIDIDTNRLRQMEDMDLLEEHNYIELNDEDQDIDKDDQAILTEQPDINKEDTI